MPADRPTFLAAPRCADLSGLDADIAVIGVPFGVPYDLRYSAMAGEAPQALRERSQDYVARYASNYDFDFGGELFAGRSVRIVDCGDVAMVPGQWAQNSMATTAAIRTILERGAVPVVLGGEDSIPIPVLRAYERYGPICVVQIDAHIDWRDERDGIREGLSSGMRRASEMPWVKGMAQIGIRGLGSARREEFDAARAYGSVLIGGEELHRAGVDEVLRRIPASDRYYIAFDADGLDPAIAPGVFGPAFGGVTYWEATNLFRGIAAKGRIVGFDLVEVMPALDVAGTTTRVGVQLILNLIGAMAHAGQIGEP